MVSNLKWYGNWIHQFLLICKLFGLITSEIHFYNFFSSFCGLFFNNGLKAAEKINIKFEEMKIPLTIEQLTKLEKYKDDSTELIDWLKIMDLSEFLNYQNF